MCLRSSALRLLACAATLLLVSGVSAQTLRMFRYLTTDNGLPGMLVFAIHQDGLGFMWFATNRGVVRWDGYEFRRYNTPRAFGDRPAPGVPYWIGEASDGELLAGGTTGLASVQAAGGTTTLLDPPYAKSQQVSGHTISGVYVAPSEPGVYWLSTYGSGLIRWERATDSVRVFLPDADDPYSIPSLRVTLPIEDSNGELWVPTERGLSRLDRSDFRFHPVTSELVVAAVEDTRHPGILWLSDSGGLTRFDTKTGRRERVIRYEEVTGDQGPFDMLYYARARSLIWDRVSPGVLWLAANLDGLYRYDTVSGEVEQYLPFREPGYRARTLSGSPACVFQDDTGVIWVGTYAGGISYAEPFMVHSRGINTSRWNAPQFPDQVNGNVKAIAEDSSGRWWIGNHDGGRFHLLMVDPATYEQRRWFEARYADGSPSIPLGEIHAILEDKRGDLWLGELHVEYSDTTAEAAKRVDWGRGAVHRLSLKDGFFKTYRHDPDDPGSLPDGGIVSLYEDSDGIIWAGTRNHGIARIDPEREEISTVNIGDESNSAWGFLEDVQGRLWVGTRDGICLIDRISLSCRPFSLPDEFTWNSTELAERPTEPGTIWVGTWKGLYRFDARAETFARPVSSGPLTTARIVDVVSDSSSVLWMPTDGEGTLRFDPDTGLIEVIEPRRPSHNLGAGMLASSGEVVFGSVGLGLKVFRTTRTLSSLTPPRVYVKQFEGVATGPLQIDLLDPGEVQLRNARESFSIEYIALHYNHPSENVFAYMLEGLHDDWQYVGTTRRASFGGLSPGTYTFRVKAASSHGIWSEAPGSLRIIVPPPWWRTWWAYVAYVFLVAAVLVTVERLRHAAVVRRERHRSELRETEIRSEVAEAKAANAAEHAHRLEEVDESKSRFFANISHEFRTPLTLILGVAEDAAAGRFGGLSDSLVRAFQLIGRHARRVEELVRELLDLARLESGTLTLVLSYVDLAQVVREVVRGHIPLAERAGVILGARMPAEPVKASIDVDKIRTAVGNLISNAIKYNAPGGEVAVSLRVLEGVEGDVARIDVKDTGIGISEEDLPRVFDRFAQVDTSPTRSTEGIGIGLALVREIIELHGGVVEADSRLGVGSTFTIELPVRKADGAADAPGVDRGEDVAQAAIPGSGLGADKLAEAEDSGVPEVGSPAVAQESTSAEGRPAATTVLLVEDNADVRTFVRGHLEPDFRVLEAVDGEEGLRLVCSNRPDLVIADIMMPKMDGIQLCRAIKSDDRLRTIPVILLTARAGEAEALEGLRAGADEYITKPFSVAQLVQRAANMIRSRAQLRASAVDRITVTPSELSEISQDEALLSRVAHVVEDHLGDSYFTVDMLADEVGLSRRQLERRMPDVCGESPSEFVRRMRLDRARQLLEADVGSVSEITYASGYRSASRFASAFRRVYGLSPSEYRHSVNGKDEG